MAQAQSWEQEYQNPRLITKYDKPQKDVLRFLKWLKKEQKISITNLNILDLGCGTGRNSNYLAENDNSVIGIDISKTAISIASERATNLGLKAKYFVGNFGNDLPFEDNSIDLIFDITSSNSLNENERKIYLRETSRVLKKDSHFLVRALCKDGDKNAKNLLKISPGSERDTYIINDLNLTERVFTEADFREMYGQLFTIKKIIKKSGYARFDGRSFKRNYLLAYLSK